MKNNLDKFIYLADLFENNGFKLFLIGGSSRDYLLGRHFLDFDVTTDATPEEIEKFLPNIKKTFAKFGSVSLEVEGMHFDITTLRKEQKYYDSRHPTNVEFVKTIEEDYVRRDFTINAIYIDHELKVYDLGTSLQDLKYVLIRMIGDPKKRLAEDPLRILRAIRFSLVLDFEIEESLFFAMREHSAKLNKINPDKINEEISKMKKAGINAMEIKSEFQKFNVLPGWKI